MVGAALLLGLLVYFVYNVLQKGLDQIPGLGFLRNVNRAGVAAVGGLGLTTGLWSLTSVLDWKVKYPTLAGGWEESPVTALCVFRDSLARSLAGWWWWCCRPM